MSTSLNVMRHMELFNPYKFDTPVTIIGAGATGSWLALQLAKLGITDITVYDYDAIEEHNVPNQFFGNLDVGFQKVTALQGKIEAETGTKIKCLDIPFTNQRLKGIVFLMVDSMQARKDIWEASIKMKSAVELLIEPRMGLNEARIYNVHPTDTKEVAGYEACWYSDEEAETSACGASLTVVTSAIATASWCARQLINHVNNVPLDNEILIDFMYNNIYPTKW